MANRSREIEFVFFDLGNVLLGFDPEVACTNVAERFGVDVAAARLAIYDSGLQHRYESGDLSSREYAKMLRLTLGKSESEMPDEGLLDAISDMFVPVEGMHDALLSVRRKGFGVGLLSNTCDAHWDWIRRQEYSESEFPFDVTILSYEIGAMKPDPRIYVAAEQACAAPAERILFLDDRRENVEGALQRNWNVVETRSASESWDALREHGVVE